MKKYTKLRFPDLIRLSNFHINFEVTKITIDLINDTITGEMSDELIDVACTDYYAYVVSIKDDIK